MAAIRDPTGTIINYVGVQVEVRRGHKRAIETENKIMYELCLFSFVSSFCHLPFLNYHPHFFFISTFFFYFLFFISISFSDQISIGP